MGEVGQAGTTPQWVFTFGDGHADGSAEDKDRLGGKGAYLAEMSRLGLPVPPGLHHLDRGLRGLLRARPQACPTS